MEKKANEVQSSSKRRALLTGLCKRLCNLFKTRVSLLLANYASAISGTFSLLQKIGIRFFSLQDFRPVYTIHYTLHTTHNTLYTIHIQN